MKNTAFMAVLLYCLSFIYTNQNIIALSTAYVIVIIFAIKYFRLSVTLENYNKITGAKLCRQRKIFADTLLHDLKIPALAQLRGLEILKKQTLGNINARQIELITQIENSCKYTLNLISMINNVYMIEENSYKLVYENLILKMLFLIVSGNCPKKQERKI